jgi:predicted nucleic acid-binding protein
MTGLIVVFCFMELNLELLVIYLKTKVRKMPLLHFNSNVITACFFSFILKKNLPLNNDHTNIDKVFQELLLQEDTCDKKIMKDDNGPKKFVLLDEN